MLEMLSSQPGRQRAVTGIAFSCDGRILAKGGASMHIRLHNFDSVLSAGTRCAPPHASVRIRSATRPIIRSRQGPGMEAPEGSGHTNQWQHCACGTMHVAVGHWLVVQLVPMQPAHAPLCSMRFPCTCTPACMETHGRA